MTAIPSNPTSTPSTPSTRTVAPRRSPVWLIAGSVRVASEVAPRSVIATSDNGSVEVLVPRTGDSYAVDVSSDNGSTTNEVITDPEAIRRITARSDNGSVRVAHSGS